MRKRVRRQLMFACFLVMMLPSFASNRELLLVSYQYPPFMDAAPGKPPTGLVIDLMTEAFKRMGVPMRIEFYPFNRDLSLLDTGAADAMFTIKKTPQRLRDYRFPKLPILSQDYVIFVAADSAIDFHGDLNVLTDLSVGVVNNASYGKVFDDFAKRGLFRHLELAQNHEANFKKLLAGRMDALVCSRVVGLAVLEQLNALKRVKVIGPPIEVAPSYIMFNKKTTAPELVTAFDKAMLAMRNDGTFEKIQRTYHTEQLN